MAFAHSISLPNDDFTLKSKVEHSNNDVADFKPGRVSVWRAKNRPDIPFYVYMPRTINHERLPLISVHGIARNAAEHALRFSAMAELYGVPIVAPLFSRKTYRMYQQFGSKDNGPRTDRIFKVALEELLQIFSGFGNKVNLFGYSGGGQFVHRFMMAYPEYVGRLVIASAGWYTFPDSKLGFPLGLMTGKHMDDLQFSPPSFLRIPVQVLVGENDCLRDHTLNTNKMVDLHQGRTRIARARNWVTAMNAAAAQLDLEEPAQLKVLPKAVHSFTRNMKKNGLAHDAFTFMYGQIKA